ncbi:MAG: GNAT family N-acetyltransferase [Lachnospiraceae bacterium]|nr:GNAT family N-acetyltransferase [Lachnospiraceae bacterium]
MSRLETDRLIISPLRETDREDYFHNISHDRKVLETFICQYCESLDEFDFSRYLENPSLFAIRRKETGCLIGIILYFDESGGACEIGYGLGSDHWGRGFATEAVRRFLEFLFCDKGLHAVNASFFTGNDASRRVMEKCGMTFSRFSEKELEYLGVERDLIYYSVTRDEWQRAFGERDL